MLNLDTLPKCPLHVTGASALQLHGYNVDTDVVEVCNKCNVSGVKVVIKSPPLRYLERAIHYNDDILLLSKEDVVVHVLSRWEDGDKELLRNTGVTKDVSEMTLVGILNREYTDKESQEILERLVAVKYSKEC